MVNINEEFDYVVTVKFSTLFNGGKYHSGVSIDINTPIEEQITTIRQCLQTLKNKIKSVGISTNFEEDDVVIDNYAKGIIKNG